ncbi:MAG: hypothetical protein ABL889_17455 [Terricaulis sp.]
MIAVRVRSDNVMYLGRIAIVLLDVRDDRISSGLETAIDNVDAGDAASLVSKRDCVTALRASISKKSPTTQIRFNLTGI